MTKALMTAEQPGRLFVYSFLTDGYRFQFFRVGRRHRGCELTYTESSVYCGKHGWQIFFGLLVASLDRLGHNFPPIAECEILGVLGCGRFSQVYRARPKPTVEESLSAGTDILSESPDVALKLYEQEYEDVATTERDALLRLAENKHVPRVVGFVRALSGYALLAVRPVGRKILPWTNGTVLSGYEFCTLLSVVKFAHDKGIIHRDIKPDNIFVDAAGCVILNDWGSSSAIGVSSMWAGTKAYTEEKPSGGVHVPNITSDLVSLARTVYSISKQLLPVGDEDGDTDPYWINAAAKSAMFAEMLTHARRGSYEDVERCLARQL